MKKLRVLVVDDSLYMRSLIKIALMKQPYEIVGEAGDGSIAVQMIKKLEPDVVILDNILPDMLGVEILEIVRNEGISTKVVMVSQMTLGELGERARSLGLDGYITKPFESEDIIKELSKISA
ncbi:MAG: response regulator [Ekhidna sp.]